MNPHQKPTTCCTLLHRKPYSPATDQRVRRRLRGITDLPVPCLLVPEKLLNEIEVQCEGVRYQCETFHFSVYIFRYTEYYMIFVDVLCRFGHGPRAGFVVGHDDEAEALGTLRRAVDANRRVGDLAKPGG